MISAGKMPTLANQARMEPPLTQIVGADAAEQVGESGATRTEVRIMPGLKQRCIELYGWFEQRLGLGTPVIEMAEHEVPENTASWWYVFGSAATVLLVLQVMTGILLALVYAPTASHAWNSLEFLDHNVKLGWFLRAVHGWGSDFMIAIVLIHMAQVFLFGAYKFSKGVDLDHRSLSVIADARNGVHRTGFAFRSGCVLGPWHRGLHCEPRAAVWWLAGGSNAGRADHRRAHA